LSNHNRFTPLEAAAWQARRLRSSRSRVQAGMPAVQSV